MYFCNGSLDWCFLLHTFQMLYTCCTNKFTEFIENLTIFVHEIIVFITFDLDLTHWLSIFKEENITRICLLCLWLALFFVVLSLIIIECSLWVFLLLLFLILIILVINLIYKILILIIFVENLLFLRHTIVDIHHLIFVIASIIWISIHQWIQSTSSVSDCIALLLKVCRLKVFIIDWSFCALSVRTAIWGCSFLWPSWHFLLKLHWIIRLLIQEMVSLLQLLSSVFSFFLLKFFVSWLVLLKNILSWVLLHCWVTVIWVQVLKTMLSIVWSSKATSAAWCVLISLWGSIIWERYAVDVSNVGISSSPFCLSIVRRMWFLSLTWDKHVHVSVMTNRRRTVTMNTMPFWWFVSFAVKHSFHFVY